MVPASGAARCFMSLLETAHDDAGDDAGWREALTAIRAGRTDAPPRWESIFGPLRAGASTTSWWSGNRPVQRSTADGPPDRPFALHQRQRTGSTISTGCARSSTLSWSGSAPRLPTTRSSTVRRVHGPSPARAVIDPTGRLPARAPAHVRRRRGRAPDITRKAPSRTPGGVESIALPAADGALAPAAILARLAARGLRRIFIEGGSDTMSRFLAVATASTRSIRGGADYPRRRAVSRRPDARRAVRRRAASADPDPPHRQRGAVRLRSEPSAGLGRPREQIDVTDPHRGAARSDQVRQRSASRRVERGRARRQFRPQRGPMPVSISFWISRSAVRTPSRSRLTIDEVAVRGETPSPQRPPFGPSAGPKPLSVSWWD